MLSIAWARTHKYMLAKRRIFSLISILSMKIKWETVRLTSQSKVRWPPGIGVNSKSDTFMSFISLTDNPGRIWVHWVSVNSPSTMYHSHLHSYMSFLHLVSMSWKRICRRNRLLRNACEFFRACKVYNQSPIAFQPKLYCDHESKIITALGLTILTW